VLKYLSAINGLLALFNFLPAFPLDGGRVLRSILWGLRGNIRWATRISSWIGEAFGILLITLGVLSVIRGNFMGGMWWFLIGLFLRNAATMSYRQLVVRKALEGEPIRRFMQPNPVVVPPSISVEELVEDYIYKHHFKMFPVVDSGKLIGCVTTRQVREIPRPDWSRKTVGELAVECSMANIVSPDADATKALSLMSRTGNSRLMVMEKGRLLGVITLKDLMKFLSLKVELED
jgi:CBS domain-containing protein